MAPLQTDFRGDGLLLEGPAFDSHHSDLMTKSEKGCTLEKVYSLSTHAEHAIMSFSPRILPNISVHAYPTAICLCID